MTDKLIKTLDKLEKEYIDFWVDICNIESPTEYKEGVDAVGKYIVDKAKKRGWQVEIQPQSVSGDCICITMNPEVKAQPVCFSAHMDTVHPIGLFGNPPVKTDDKNIYGPGVVDCKGGIASSFMAMAALEDLGYKKRPLKLILQSDEENSSRNSNKTTVEFMCEKSKDAIAFLNCEGYSKGKLTLERKGLRKYKFEITGKAVHSAKCYDGASAVAEAAYKIIELEKMKDKDGITCNCGLINGGTAENTVPEKCTFTADIRAKTSEQIEYVEKLVKEIADKSYVEGTSCKLILASWRYPMEKSVRNYELFEKIRKIFIENGLEDLESVTGGGASDAADVTHYGIPCVDSIGVTGEFIHSVREYAEIASMKKSAKMLALIADNIE